MKKLIALLLIITALFLLASCTSPVDPTPDSGICTNGHSYGDWVILTEATCTTDGERYRECTVCLYIDEEFPKASDELHRFGDWKTLLSATCVDDGERSRTCEICKKPEVEDIPATGNHDYIGGICSVCDDIEEGATIIPPAPISPDTCEHNYSSVTYPADCENRGYTLKTCSKCGFYYKTDYVAALGHTGNTYCSTCGEVILPEDVFED